MATVLGTVINIVPNLVSWFFSSAFDSEQLVKRKPQEDDEELLALKLVFEDGVGSRQRIRGFVENLVPFYTDYEFRRHFRLRRCTVEILIQTFGSDLSKKTILGRPAYDPQKIVLLSIWTAANQESFRLISDRFGVGEGHAYSLFILFCEVVSSRVSEFISWPTGQEAHRIAQEFESLRSQPFPGVMGCVDGSYIPVKGRRSDNSSYHTRKGFRATTLQGICSAKLVFIDVFVGWPGSSHDARVWRNSRIYKALESNSDRMLPDGKHLLGDSAYPLSKNLLVPYRDNGFLTSSQKYFNKKLSSSRVVIENAFGLLKSRFRRLKFLDMIRLDRASKIIITACVLHNMCIEQDDLLEDHELSRDGHLIEEMPLERHESNNCGILKRDYIAQMLYESR